MWQMSAADLIREVNVQGDVPRLENMAAREVAIHISNHSMVKADRGVVIVGASVELGAVGNTADSGSNPAPSFPVISFFFSPYSFRCYLGR